MKMQKIINTMNIRRYGSKIFLILVLIVFLSPSSTFLCKVQNIRTKPKSNPKTVKLSLDQYLDYYYKVKKPASITAGILLKGKTIWVNSKGYADISKKVYANPETIYRTASISKIITAVAVMQLVERGKINLDDDIRKYISYFPKKRWKFTIRQVLQHTAGLRGYRTGEFNNLQEFSTARKAVEVIANDSLLFMPGTRYLYTTLGYNLLAAVIENVSSQSYYKYLKKNIFIPADMRNTGLEFQKIQEPRLAKGYKENIYRKLIETPRVNLSIKYAGGGIISAAEDLLKFSLCLMKGKLLSAEYIDTMLVPVKLANGKSVKGGLGFEIYNSNENQYCFGHRGFGTGFVSMLVIFPKEKLAAVSLINTGDRDAGSPALDLASIIMNKEIKYPLISLSGRMMEIILQKGIDAAIEYSLVLKRDSSKFYNLSSREYDMFGYDLLKIKKHYAAVKWFRFFGEEYPGNISAHIGLGDAYYKEGNKGLALKAYIKASFLDNKNKYVKKQIQLLDSGI